MAKQFAFKLEPFLRLREFAEKNARMELGRAVSALNEAEAAIAENRARREKAASERFSPTGASRDFLVYDNYLNRLDAELPGLEEKREAAAQNVAEKQAAYNEAYADMKSLQEVRKVRFAEWKKKREATEEDESAEASRR
jgi:flagellar FliJ protein